MASRAWATSAIKSSVASRPQLKRTISGLMPHAPSSASFILAMRGIGGMRTARAGVGHGWRFARASRLFMNCSAAASASEAEAYHATGAIRHVFLQVVILVAFEGPGSLRSGSSDGLQEFRHGQAVLAMLRACVHAGFPASCSGRTPLAGSTWGPGRASVERWLS